MDIQKLKETTLTPTQQAFIACRGDHINNIVDLANCIESLSEPEFKHHVGSERNDFATWILDVLENPALAHDLGYEANIEDKEQCVKTIRDHVSWLENS